MTTTSVPGIAYPQDLAGLAADLAALGGVRATTDPITGGIDLSAGGTPIKGADFIEPHIAKAVSYVGNGAVRSLDFGFRPDLVIIKGEGRPAVIYNSDQWYGNIQSFGHTTYSGSDGLPPPAINENGVALMYHAGAPAKDAYNENGITYHAVALKDNGVGFFKSLAYNGHRNQTVVANGANSNTVTMDALNGYSPKWVHIKRDATGAGHEGVWASDDGYVKKESATAVNSALLTYVAGGSLNLSTDISVNENDGTIVGEAHNVFALLSNPSCWEEKTYTGGGSPSLTFSKQLAVAIILPVAAEEMVFASPTMAGAATGGATAINSGVRVTNNTLSVTGSLANTTGIQYRVIGIFLGAATPKATKIAPLPGVVLQAGAGRIVCGTDASLGVAGAHSIEWIGSIADYNTEQFIFGRMNGGRATPAAATYNYAIAHTRDPDAGIEICTSDRFSGEATNVSKQQRWRTGIVLTPFETVHLLYTHDGIDKWCLYLNGRLVKWRRLPMSVFTLPGITNTAGLTVAFGGRLASANYFANLATVHKFGRIYNRELTEAEAQKMYLRNAVKAVPTQTYTDVSDYATSLVEEWRFLDGSGTTVVATKSATNNGVITSGTWTK